LAALCSSSAQLVTSGMLPTTTLELSTLAAEFARADARPAMTMAICEMTT
jgi:hypothetical protein